MKISLDIEIPEDVLKAVFGIADVNVDLVKDSIRLSYYQFMIENHGDLREVADWLTFSDEVEETQKRIKENVLLIIQKLRGNN